MTRPYVILASIEYSPRDERLQHVRLTGVVCSDSSVHERMAICARVDQTLLSQVRWSQQSARTQAIEDRKGLSAHQGLYTQKPCFGLRGIKRAWSEHPAPHRARAKLQA